MKIYSVADMPNTLILGRQTETGVEEIRIDCAPWLSRWPGLNISAWVTDPGGSAVYPADTHMEGDLLVWPVSNADTAKAGSGYVEIVGMAEGLKKLSAFSNTRILGTTTGAETDPPDPAKPWVDKVLEAVNNGGSGGGSGDIFIVKCAPKTEGSFLQYADKTPDEIRAAAASGKVCLLQYKGRVYTYFGERGLSSLPKEDDEKYPTFISPSDYGISAAGKQGLVWWCASITDDCFVNTHGYSPAKTPNPEKLTLKGAVNVTYDGSEAITITIPEAGSSTKTARIGVVSLPASAWVGADSLYSQVVDIEGVTENSQVDLTPDVQQLAIFYEKDLALVTENEGGVVTVYAIGQKPANDYTIQVTITEVAV